MPLLEAFLALALTMLSCAMVATLIVELGLRIAKTRSSDLKIMLEAYYDRQLKPIVEKELKKTGAQLEKHKRDFIEGLVTNPLLLSDKKAETFFKAIVKPKYFVKPLVKLSTEDFLKKLANSDIGKQIKAKTEAEVDRAVDSLSLAYDEFGTAASDLFRRRSQLISLGAGILVAFLLNMNAVTILKSYLNDPVARGQLIAQADAITARYEASLSETAEGTEQEGSGAESENPGPPPNVAQVKAIAGDLETAIDDLRQSEIAFGYRPEVAPATLWRDGEGNWLGLAAWFAGVLGTGFLIGLGCPFWYNIVTKVTSVLRTARGGGVPVPAAGEGTGASQVEAMQPHREIFKRTGELLESDKSEDAKGG